MTAYNLVKTHNGTSGYFKKEMKNANANCNKTQF